MVDREPKAAGSSAKTRRSFRALAWVSLTVAAAALGWAVVHALDAGSRSIAEKDSPLSISLETNPARQFRGLPAWQNYSFVIPDATPNVLPPPPSSRCRDWWSWARHHGGRDGDISEIYATLQGTPGTALVITGVSAGVVRRRPAPHGVEGVCQAIGGAVGSPRLVDVNLDHRPPVVLLAKEGDDYPSRGQLSLTLNGSETEQLVIRAHTTTCDCRWRLRLALVVNGEKGSAVIDDGGRPFRTIASSAATPVRWERRRWRRMSAADWRQTRPIDWQARDFPAANSGG